MLSQQEYVGLLIASARRSLKQAVLGRARRFRLTPVQFWLLLSLGERAGAPLVELARRQRIDSPTASRVVAALRRRGLVRLQGDPRDRRRAQVDLTPAGVALLPQLRPIGAGVRAAVIAGMSEAEVETLRKGLRKVIVNLEQFEQDGRNAKGGRKAAASSRSVVVPRPRATRARATRAG